MSSHNNENNLNNPEASEKNKKSEEHEEKIGEVLNAQAASSTSDTSNIENENVKKPLESVAFTLEREISLREEKNPTNLLQLPTKNIPNTPSLESSIVGDDVAKTHVHIVCECEKADVRGGAVPVVTSFIQSANQETPFRKESPKSLKKSSQIPKLTSSLRNARMLNQMDKFHGFIINRETTEKSTRNIYFGNNEKKNDENDNERDETKNNEIKMQQERDRKLSKEFSKYISTLAHEVSNLTENKSPAAQMSVVDELYNQITNLKRIANEIKTIRIKTPSEPTILGTSAEETDFELPKSKLKDNNKIYIKFLPSKAIVKKKRNSNPEDDVTITNPKQNTEDLKEVDSVYGMFIPSFDEPPKIEDDEDEDGLDITITFPELQEPLNDNDSHLSVCFSNISAEALGHLKRCPKDFTLRMDFVQGKMFFQSGKSPANNYSIGPDFTITECFIDARKSDIISIKPSTECGYASQILPVQVATGRDSLKILKNADSELFSVVSMQFVNKILSTATKSCMNFKNVNRKVSSESQLQSRQYYKSMPQIPSLTKTLEEPILPNVTNTARPGTSNCEKKSRNQNTQKKKIGVNLDDAMYEN